MRTFKKWENLISLEPYCAIHPDSELAKMLREVAEKESEAGIKFKVVEKGGTTIEKMLQNSKWQIWKK